LAVSLERQFTNEDIKRDAISFGLAVNRAPPFVALLELINIKFANMRSLAVAEAVVGEHKKA
jgi:hypothetical protein